MHRQQRCSLQQVFSRNSSFPDLTCTWFLLLLLLLL
jgi:hypothetical protein